MTQFILISSINEIYQNDTTKILKIISYIYAIFLLLLFIFLLCFVLYLTFSTYRLNENEHNKLGEFFRGLKNIRKSRTYIPILLIRRLVYVAFLITLVSVPSRPLIGILSTIQIFYLSWIIIIRPYEETKGNIIEILNEFYFTFLLTVLIFFNTKEDWNSTVISTYVWIMTSNTIAVFAIVLGKIG